MEGPTPVSALIHAATMVTAGVYLIARCHIVFELAPNILDLVAGLGAATLLVAGLIALVQTDIKRVIAYSTMSQIGYMFVGVGVGAYSSGMFHLLTHAFFKALLFLAAGLIIHALAGEQDIRKMGGLRKLMPLTYWFFLVGGLALVGIPPFAGFFSKDPILAATLAHGTFGIVLWVAGVLGAFLTGALHRSACCSSSSGASRAPYAREHHHRHDGKEGPAVMFCARRRARRALGRRRLDPGRGALDADLQLPRDVRAAARRGDAGRRRSSRASSRCCSASIGIGVAWAIYGARRAEAPRVPAGAAASSSTSSTFDELYDARLLPARPCGSRSALLRWFERPVIGGSRDRARASARRSRAAVLSRVQTGLLRAVRARARRRARRPRRRLHLGALMNAWLDDDPDLPPVAGALACFVLPLGGYATARSRCSSRSSRSASGSTALHALRLLAAACSSSSGRRGSATCNVSYHVGMFGFSLWLVGLTVVVHGGGDRLRFLAGPRPAARVLRPDADADSARSSASSRRRTSSSST